MNDASKVHDIMTQFAERTGLTTQIHPPRRYLWTDAFAVCNYLALYRQTGKEGYLRDAATLVEQVHTVLGRHREDDPRSGWISGLDEQEGERHPTRGGLRIGKKLGERGRDQPFDERLEWDRDGQYFHYLTKWMHALNCAARVTGNADYIRWALELARTVHAAFVYSPLPSGRKRMYWKMSIDLSHPLVPSMGQHDPLDGLITYQQLQASAMEFAETAPEFGLQNKIAEMTAICEGMSWYTHDALGVGGLLADACRLSQLIVIANLRESARLASLLDDAEAGLNALARSSPLDYPTDYRLAFRELGLSIGLHAIEKMQQMLEEHADKFANQRALKTKLTNLTRFLPWIETIERFWSTPVNQEVSTWVEHQDINSVMLATSLAPDGYLILSNASTTRREGYL
jgi:hypothetical protein